MPIFQYKSDLEEGPRPSSPAGVQGDRSPARPIPFATPPLTRQLSEESIRTELCEGPLLDNLPSQQPKSDPHQEVTTSATSDRAELIERLKRGESPTWIPNRHIQIESLFHQQGILEQPARSHSPRPLADSPPKLLPAATITSDHTQDGVDIERPRSALHSGDFTQDHHVSGGSRPLQAPIRHLQQQQPTWERPWPGGERFPVYGGLAISPQPQPPPPLQPLQRERPQPQQKRHQPSAIDIGVRTPLPRSSGFDSPVCEPSLSRGSGFSSLSSSLSSSFAFRHPTSPLAQSESNEDLDLRLPLSNIDLGPSRNPRRHTLSTRDYPSPTHFSTSLRRDGSLPYQAHQPRRSLTSTPSWSPAAWADASPRSPSGFLRTRQQSLGSDTSPLHHASMVGSYEESILRGRMSTTPSRPLDFVAQIGVLGLGECKPSLRCPPHVTLPFSAVFYSYSSTSHGRSASEEGPSPYVGMIDLENGLKDHGSDGRARRKAQSRNLALRAKKEAADDVSMVGNLPEDTDPSDPSDPSAAAAELESRKTAKSRQQSSSPRTPPGGSYRIPQKGRLQLIIKNQNKTAVKLFLVPYDLAGMEAGTKTFIRQRSFSLAENSHADGSQDSLAKPRPILRYLIHLHVCCPAKGRYYLYKSVRVVFANRVPDGKEKLQNEITLPEPRFSAYKPVRVMAPMPILPPQMTGPGALLAVDKASRRRSAGFMFGDHSFRGGPSFDTLDGISRSLSGGAASSQASGASHSANERAYMSESVDPTAHPGCRVISRGRLESITSEGSDATLRAPSSTGEATCGSPSQYNKLSKGDIGYGGNAFMQSGDAHSPRAAAEGLISQRLRSLGAQKVDEFGNDSRGGRRGGDSP